MSFQGAKSGKRARVAATVAFAGCAIFFAAGSSATASALSAPWVTLAPPTCPASDACVTIPDGVTPPPEVQAGPVNGLGRGQWVFVNLYDFPPGGVANLQYCSAVAPLSVSPPLCDESGSQTLPNPTVNVPIPGNGAASISFEVSEVSSATGDTPLSGTVPGTSHTGSYFCNDTSADACAIDVTDPAIGTNPGDVTPLVGNTAVVPVSFASNGSACSSAATITTESDYGFSYLLPAAWP